MKPSQYRRLNFLLDVLATKYLADKLCAFCGHRTGKKATVHTAERDYVCQECRDDFEYYLNTGDTE
jgi:hypothetical protein